MKKLIEVGYLSYGPAGDPIYEANVLMGVARYQAAYGPWQID